MDTGQILAEILVGGELKIHLIGVAGSGMSGIAGLLMSLGHHVSGSDKVSTIEVERLQKLGLEFYLQQQAAAVTNADLVIFSSAIRPGNVEYDEAVRTDKSMVRRADALAAIMNCKKGIIVAGMHGKTTTSSMAAHVLRAGGVKPSHYVGAEIPILGTNAHWDSEGEYFVAEGDESDGTLAFYHSEHAIILNIEEVISTTTKTSPQSKWCSTKCSTRRAGIFSTARTMQTLRAFVHQGRALFRTARVRMLTTAFRQFFRRRSALSSRFSGTANGSAISR